MEILNTTEILKTRNNALVIVFIIMLMALFGIIITLISCIKVSNGMFIAWFICMIACTAAVIWFADKVPTGIYQYEVLLTDNYSATQLLQDYDVVGQRGSIWIIQDKENNMDKYNTIIDDDEYDCCEDNDDSEAEGEEWK